MNNSQVQPFNLPIEVTWVLSIIIPILIAMSGWFIVFLLNKKHLRLEKKIIIKIHAFDYIKNIINELLKSGSELHSFIFITKTTLAGLEPDNIIYKYHKHKLEEDFREDSFNKLKDSFIRAFSQFILSWEQYEIVFKHIVVQRYALQEEFNQVIDRLTKVWGEYHRYLLNIKAVTPLNDENREILISSLSGLYNQILDFAGCIGDVNFNIQNYVFGDVLKELNDKRIVKDKSFLTIDTLIVKHANKLKNYYGVKLKQIKKC